MRAQVLAAGALALAGAIAASALAQPSSPECHATLPAPSPDGAFIAYVRDTADDTSQVRVAGVDGGGDRLVIRVAGEEGAPAWTDRGTRLSFATDSAGLVTLWSVSLAGDDARVLARENAMSLRLSHDGRRLARSLGSWQRSKVVVSELGGGHARTLTDSTAAWFNLAWSPDDRWIAATRLDTTHAAQVWLIEVASGRTRALTSFGAGDGAPQWPAWSPDGRRIALQAGRYDRAEPQKSEADIWLIDVASGRPTRITTRERPWLDEAPSWLADGRHLAIQSTRTGRFEVWVIADDGRSARQVTR